MFIIEGIKAITEFFGSAYRLHSIYHTGNLPANFEDTGTNIKLFEVNQTELERISTLQTPQDMLALVHMPQQQHIAADALRGQFSLLLDGIQDPGNLGTIIRTADWFGFDKIICSANTVEAYNPKTVQATMGSLARMEIFYTDLAALIRSANLPVYGALLDGESIYDIPWGKEGLVVLGNEGQGISAELRSFVSRAVTIPRKGGAESLNVAISAAIFCSELTRHMH
ncbi:TrmH family RNA methyltransferase [Pedobacter sp. SYP-B3415]|uniref:TrmH family RNA methyltransferase n=1 Tax=Pedobacter sp. SYP-B3415 TaxID=2496641 RepID=UPI0035111C1C